MKLHKFTIPKQHLKGGGEGGRGEGKGGGRERGGGGGQSLSDVSMHAFPGPSLLLK